MGVHIEALTGGILANAMNFKMSYVRVLWSFISASCCMSVIERQLFALS